MALPVRKTGNLRGCQMDMFESSEQTGTGSSQNVAHSLGFTPTKVWASLTGFTAAALPQDAGGCITSRCKSKPGKRSDG